MSAAERLRVPSAGNLREPGSAPYQPPHAQTLQGHLRKDNRELDKAKSIPNLRMDNSFDGRPDNMMRPAQSVSALQQQRVPNNTDYYNQPHSLDESRTPDYENQPIDPRLRHQDMRGGYPNTSQASPSTQYSKPHQPPTSRSMQNFERPQSAYYGQHDRPDFIGGRPKSDEISPEKLRNWQDMDRSHASSHDQSFENQSPNYSNIRPQPNYANQGEIRKMDVGSQPRQPNFYENTVPRQQEPTPPFQQLRRPPSESDKKGPPPVTPKPAIKPNQPIIQPAEIPRSDVDNRQTQPHFYNARPQDRPVYPNTSQANYNPSPHHTPSPHQSHYQNTSFHGPSPGVNDYRNKTSPARDFGKKGLDMPPPPIDIPPELPPPPSIDDIQDDDLPPLPPPPVTDYRLEQKIREEQNRLLQQQQQQQQGDPSYSNLPPSRNTSHLGSPVVQNGQRSPHDRSNYPAQHSLPPHSAGYQPPQSSGYQPQPQSLPPPHTAGYSPSHDYQNINYPNRTEPSQNGPGQHPQQNLYETYDPRRQQQNMRPPISEGLIKEQREAIISPWEREAKEKQHKQQTNDLNRLREMEIADLESRPQLNPQEEERLRKLRLDQEFQRRLQEVSNKDDDEDSDDDRMVSLITSCLTFCILGILMRFCRLLIFFTINFFKKFFQELPSECQTDWIQIRSDILSGLIWVQTVCISYH